MIQIHQFQMPTARLAQIKTSVIKIINGFGHLIYVSHQLSNCLFCLIVASMILQSYKFTVVPRVLCDTLKGVSVHRRTRSSYGLCTRFFRLKGEGSSCPTAQ